MKKFTTPFNVRSGIFYDRYFMPLEMSSVDYYLSAVDDDKINIDFSHFIRKGINMIRFHIDDSLIADSDGNILECNSLYLFDEIINKAFEYGLYLTLIPVISGMIKKFDATIITRQQRYFSLLFTRENLISGNRLYEYENIVALEILFDINGFSDEQFNLYCGRVMMEVFIDQYFLHRVLKIYSLERGVLSKTQMNIMEKHHIKIINVDVFKPHDNHKLQFEPFLPGIPESVIRAGIRSSEKSTWAPLAVGESMSILEHPHANGGAEGWLTFAADIPVDLRLDFPYQVKTAKFRPSMLESLDVSIDGNTVEITLPSARYGALEINYDAGNDIPSYTVFILGDSVIEDPADTVASSRIKFIESGTHSLNDISFDNSKILYFLPGLHEIEGNKIIMQSNRDIYISRGAVVRAGVIGEEVENARFFGQGILDGTSNPRDVGENKGSRMGEKWLDDAGYEGFVCFFKGRNITFDGPVIYNSNYWNIVISGTHDAVVRNYKAITWLQNTDGVQPRSCTNLLIEHCFLKCADDCIAIKTRRTLALESRNIVCRDLVLWHDRVGNGLQIGATSQADLLENVTFKDIYAIYGGEAGHCIGMCIIDHSTVCNVLYEDIYVEGCNFGCNFSFVIQPDYYTTDSKRGNIKGVAIRGYYSEAPILQNSLIRGFNSEHIVENVLFEDIYENCENMKDKRKINLLSAFIKEDINSTNILIK